MRDEIEEIRSTMAAQIADDEVNIVLCTGGAVVTGRDGTPEVNSIFV